MARTARGGHVRGVDERGRKHRGHGTRLVGRRTGASALAHLAYPAHLAQTHTREAVRLSQKSSPSGSGADLAT